MLEPDRQTRVDASRNLRCLSACKCVVAEFKVTGVEQVLPDSEHLKLFGGMPAKPGIERRVGFHVLTGKVIDIPPNQI